jgi:energy-coupling factor transporter ATP-binding protein EcfA2
VGWQKLVLLAIAQAIGAELLLLDEPLSGLSADAITRVLSWMQEYLQSGKAIIVAEHNAAISSLSPRQLVLGNR